MRKPSIYEIIMMVLIAIMIIILIVVCGCSTENITPNKQLRGRWYSTYISKSYGHGMAETFIVFYDNTYLFGSNTIAGEVRQQGGYYYDGRVLKIELSFSPNPFALTGKSGSEWIVQIESDTLMNWICNTDNTEVIKWVSRESTLIDEGSRKDRRPPEEPGILPPPPDVL